MAGAERTFESLPPHSSCLVRGVSANDWNASSCSPHLAQRYTYVGMDAPSGRSSRLALDAYECQSYMPMGRLRAPLPSGRFAVVFLLRVDAALRSPPVVGTEWLRMVAVAR